MNEAAWKKISKADQDAISKISGEAFARATGKAWDKNAAGGFDAFKAGGGQIVPADATLVKGVADKTARFEQEWVKAATDKGLNGAAILAEYREELKKIAAGQ
jgi:TRAP-type C4-dicarboxylate transport system substrate-binding protein